EGGIAGLKVALVPIPPRGDVIELFGDGVAGNAASIERGPFFAPGMPARVRVRLMRLLKFLSDAPPAERVGAQLVLLDTARTAVDSARQRFREDASGRPCRHGRADRGG